MIQRWDIITIGNVSRNRYWGESDASAVRSVLCTCTLVTAPDYRMLVDPSLQDEAAMAHELDRRSGLKPPAIDLVFITHAHGDHHWGMKHFPAAQWLAAAPTAELINRSGEYEKRVEAVGDNIRDLIDVIPAPGHCDDLHSLRFDCAGESVVLAGDAVVTRDYWAERRGFFNSVDFERAKQSIENLTGLADVIVPGHDNYFRISLLSKLRPPSNLHS